MQVVFSEMLIEFEWPSLEVCSLGIGLLSFSSLQLMAQFRIFPSSESRHSFVANYTSAVKFKIHILVLFCCIIIPLYVSESKYL